MDCGQDSGQRGALNAGEHAQDHFGGGHCGTGIAGSKEACCIAFADHLKAYAHGGVALGADGLSGLVVHLDPLAGGDDEDGHVSLALQRLAQSWADDVFGTYQVNANVLELAARKHGPANLRFGGLVGTHCVDHDVYRHPSRNSLGSGLVCKAAGVLKNNKNDLLDCLF